MKIVHGASGEQAPSVAHAAQGRDAVAAGRPLGTRADGGIGADHVERYGGAAECGGDMAAGAMGGEEWLASLRGVVGGAEFSRLELEKVEGEGKCELARWTHRFGERSDDEGLDAHCEREEAVLESRGALQVDLPADRAKIRDGRGVVDPVIGDVESPRRNAAGRLRSHLETLRIPTFRDRGRGCCAPRRGRSPMTELWQVAQVTAGSGGPAGTFVHIVLPSALSCTQKPKCVARSPEPIACVTLATSCMGY